MSSPDPLVALIVEWLTEWDASARRKMPGAVWLPRWSDDEFDGAGRAVAGMIRRAVDEAVGLYFDQIEREIVNVVVEEIDRRTRETD